MGRAVVAARLVGDLRHDHALADTSSRQPSASRPLLEADEGGLRMSATASVALPAQHVRQAPQHLQALERANRVRLARAELKRRVAEGELSVADVILGRPWEAESMEIADLLLSQRRWGWTRARRALPTIPVPENKTIGSMTDRQRRALAEKLGRRVP